MEPRLGGPLEIKSRILSASRHDARLSTLAKALVLKMADEETFNLNRTEKLPLIKSPVLSVTERTDTATLSGAGRALSSSSLGLPGSEKQPNLLTDMPEFQKVSLVFKRM